MASSLHLPTGQLCGPHARAYVSALCATQTELLGAELGVDLSAPQGCPNRTNADATSSTFSSSLAFPAPQPFAARSPTPRPAVWDANVRSHDPGVRRQDTMWFDGDLCLGSVNLENLWQQRHPLIAYSEIRDTIALLRLGCHDGEKTSSRGSRGLRRPGYAREA